MRHTNAFIDLKNLEHNYNRIKEISNNTSILAIVKANAYGHGMIPVAKKLEELGVEYFGVAFADEGVQLRQAGIERPIVVLVPETNGNASLCCEYNLEPVIYSLDFAQALFEASQKAGKISKAHLFIDTGMNREGLKPDFAVDFLNRISNLNSIEIIGILTHFASSVSNLDFAKKQLVLFNNILDDLNANGFNFKYIHASNSGAIFNLPEARFNMIRPGITLYGYPPGEDMFDDYKLKPILTLKTKVISKRKILKGDTVGYSLEFISDKDTTIVTIPIGYGDGFFKTLSHKAECLINGKRYRIVGTICMDICMVDVGDDEIEVGDEVVIIGEQGSNRITAYDLANKISSIPYEVISSISVRVPRIYTQ